MERYAIYCKNSVTGEWMLASQMHYTYQGAVSYSKIYTTIGFEVEIRVWYAK
jgi:hypothetical protein